MIKNDYYYDSIALLFKNNNIIGWVPTQNEADEICKIHKELEWDSYREHTKYVDLKKIDNMSYLLTTKTLTNVLDKDADKCANPKANQTD